MAEPVEIATRYYDALDRLSLDDVQKALAPDVVARVPGAVLEGPGAVAGWMGAFFDAFPDITHEHSGLTVDGQSVSTDLVVRGTHTAPLVSPDGALPATGKPIELHAHNVMQVGDDAITELEITFDPGEMMSQLGMA